MNWVSSPIGLKAFKLTVQVTIAFFGVVGNILICCVVSKSTNMRSRTYYYIACLAVADLGVLLVNFPLAIVKEQMLFRWPFGEFSCLYIYPITDIFFGASIWSIAVIAIDRYRSIVREIMIQRRSNSNSRKSTFFAICSVWVTSFAVVNLPLYFVIDYNPKMQVCFLRWSPSKIGSFLRDSYMVILVIFLYILPLTIITFTYCCISRRLQASNTFLKSLRREKNTLKEQRNKSEFLKNEEKKILKKNKKAKKILTPLVLIFAVSMLPLNVFRLAMTFEPRIIAWNHYWTCFTVVIVFTVINSSCNPIVYAIVCKEFRKGLRELLLCQSVQKRHKKTIDLHLLTKSTQRTRPTLFQP